MTRFAHRFTCEPMPDPYWVGTFFTYTATAAVAGVAAVAGMSVDPVSAATATPTPSEDQRKFMAEATRLAIELVEKGWAGPSCGDREERPDHRPRSEPRVVDRLPSASRRGHRNNGCVR